MTKEELKELEEKYGGEAFDKKYRARFEKQAMFMGNGIYSIAGLYATDTRELYLMFVRQQEYRPRNRQSKVK